MAEEKPKENFIKAIEIIEAEHKFTMLAFSAPLLLFIAKLDLILKIQGTCIKLFLSFSFIILFIGLFWTIHNLLFVRLWKGKEILLLDGETSKGKELFSYLESLSKKLKIGLNEQGIIKLIKTGRVWLAWLLALGWLFLILALLFAMWTENSITTAQIGVTENTIIVHTQEKSDN